MDMRGRLTALGLVVVATVAAAVLVRDGRPVLIRMPFGINQETGDHNYVLFNPFRDRSPERAAAAYLGAMRRGNCADAERLSTNLVLPNEFNCEEMQSEYRDHRDLFVQRLRDRKEDRGDVLSCTIRTPGQVLRATGWLCDGRETTGESSASTRFGSTRVDSWQKFPFHHYYSTLRRRMRTFSRHSGIY